MTREQNETTKIRVIHIAEKLRIEPSRVGFLSKGMILYSPFIGSITSLGNGLLFDILL